MKTNYSSLYRIFHWTIAISFFLLLLTIFLRLTWMNKDNMADIIGTYLTDSGQVLSREQLLVLAKQIRQPMWNWHLYIGYFLAVLFSLRFLLPLFGVLKFQNPFSKGASIKEKLQKAVYLGFYLCVGISLISGLIMELGPGNLKEPLEEIHVLSLYYLIPFIIVHLAGVFTAEFTDQKGIVSRMLSGKRSKDLKILK